MVNQPLCSSSFVVPAFNMRCDPEGRYDLPGAAVGSAPLPDPHAIESSKLASNVSDWMQTNNGQTSGALPVAETVSSVAYYRAIALAANDFCWEEPCCAGKNPALHHIPTIASCSCGVVRNVQALRRALRQKTHRVIHPSSQPASHPRACIPP
eukprot:GHVU01034083.1.p2 GENE.GHVU01034083.1~~GHVU01034083.1.p2  ORF type:complete len:153 (+),score=6.13 GHVU01034083.1:2-460(+)